MKNKLNFSITIILFEPQLDENIGAVARAMLNFNLSNLRIIKKGWKPNKVSIKNSAKADSILKNAKVFKSLEEGINDLNYVYAKYNRKRDLSTKVVNLKEAVKRVEKQRNANSRVFTALHLLRLADSQDSEAAGKNSLGGRDK